MSDLQSSSSDSDIADHPDLGDDTQESEVAHDLLFSSGALASAATVTQAADKQIEFELLDKPHQPLSGQESSLRGNLVNLFLCYCTRHCNHTHKIS